VLTQYVEIPEWQFNALLVGHDRLERLSENVPFSEVVARVGGVRNINFSAEPGNREAKGWIRAAWVLEVTPELFDLFFNSSSGYRGQFYLAPQRGLEANRLLIDSLHGRLLASADAGPPNPNMTRRQVEASLTSRYAKVWIDEDSSTLDQTSKDPVIIQALEVPKWVTAMKDALSAWRQGKSPDAYVARSLLGVQAPEGQRLDIRGAWMDRGNTDHVVPSKEDRAEHIHKFGFS
jgi:hypothetical protein